MKARIILVAALAVLVALPAGVQAQKKGKKQAEKNVLTLHIENSADDTVYMGNYYAKGTYATDTALNDGKGNYVFKRLPEYDGLYFFTNQKGKYVEFVVYGGEKPTFEFTTNDEDWKAFMRVKGSRENEVFFAFHNERK